MLSPCILLIASRFVSWIIFRWRGTQWGHASRPRTFSTGWIRPRVTPRHTAITAGAWGVDSAGSFGILIGFRPRRAVRRRSTTQKLPGVRRGNYRTEKCVPNPVKLFIVPGCPHGHGRGLEKYKNKNIPRPPAGTWFTTDRGTAREIISRATRYTRYRSLPDRVRFENRRGRG